MTASCDEDFDIIVVGAGMFGSSCAKYLCKMSPGASIALVGPGEPEDRADTEVFGCWHDEGRLYNCRDSYGCWGHFSRESIKRFAAIEAESNTRFHVDCGFLSVVGPEYLGLQDWLGYTGDVIRARGAALYNSVQLTRQFPFLSVPGDGLGCHEAAGAGGGYISPRQFVTAQQEIAKAAGCRMVRSLVTDISRAGAGYSVTTNTGQVYHCQKLVLCQGTHLGLSSPARSLFPAPELWFTAQTVALLEVGEEEARRLREMPSMVVQTHPTQYIYILPPILYPDGKMYLKLGQHDLDKNLRTARDVTLHYRAGPDPRHVSKLVKEALYLFPHLNILNVVGDSCVTLNTPDKFGPYIDIALPGLVVAGAGCGHGAKGADEIGRVAAVLSLTGEWDCPLDRDVCRLRYRQLSSKI